MGATILLADDSVTIQKVIELTFAETDHHVVAVGSGRELLDQVGQVKPDAVLCDVVMPDMNGYDICQALKSEPNTLHIPVVLLTGTFEPFDRTRALAAGCDAIVTKPFEAEELIRTVEELLRRASRPEPAAPTGMHAVGVPDGVPSLDFTTTGFERMGAHAAPPAPGIPDEGIDFDSTGPGRASRPAASEGEEEVFGFEAAGEDVDTPREAPVGDELPDAEEAEGGLVEDETFPSVAPPSRAEEEADEERHDVEASVGAAPEAEPEPGPEGEADGEGELDATVIEPAPAPRAAPPQPQPQPLAAERPSLSDEQIEAIARKVVELAGPMLERIAWEVLPDMAEMLVRKRIRELEEAAEQEM